VSYLQDGIILGNFIYLLIFRALADILYIYPNKRKKKSFENQRDEILRNGLEAAISGGARNNNLGKTGRN
jgi:hypothetical protein